MTPAKTVQFRDPESVLEAYEQQGIASFAIFTGKQLHAAYPHDDIADGAEDLRKCLDRLVKSRSAGIYTLVVYKGFGAEDVITEKTDYHGSCNFRFAEFGEGEYSPPGRGNGQRYIGYADPQESAIMSKLNAMALKQDELERRLDQEREEEDESVGALAQVAKLMDHPIMPMVLGLIQQYLPKPSGQQSPAPVHSIQPGAPPASQMISGIVQDYMSPDEMITRALEILRTKADDFPALLLKLADMSLKKPMQFMIMLATLRSMKL